MTTTEKRTEMGTRIEVAGCVVQREAEGRWVSVRTYTRSDAAVIVRAFLRRGFSATMRPDHMDRARRWIDVTVSE